MESSTVSSKSAMDDDRAHPKHNASRFPVEVCENIIDMLQLGPRRRTNKDSRALHHCALVCRAWRVRSQRNLFYSFVLHDLPALQKFSAVLDNRPHLCDYVHEVTILGGTLYTTASPLSLLPIALREKLPRLQKLTVVRKGDGWYPETAKPGTVKSLRYLPLHHRFKLFLSAFTTVSHLNIFNVTFRYFSDLARMINSLPALRILICGGVRCMALGPMPLNVKPRADGIHTPALPFAPNLPELRLGCVDIYCTQ
ncbi:hypothetical protein BD311DRAFT_407438 [Dichomitus squalens]|uniref:F-box domain-containing protein n=1 Tax=Dichomitus squalens TaxID=114155 RepID=A0A4Q9MJX4_9APHY|nr:hypothetical protein BD311DRAFT_407438 [Dichomitus squalens]